ncbi:MAG: Gfo/Idh/MocA family oxidoreductase [Armatimonadota bacterium]
METINVGIIGTGGIARGQHMPAIKKVEGVKILAVSDVNEDSAKSAAEEFDVNHVFTDYKKMLDMDELDAVHICTPNFLHMPPAVEALNAGKHVIVEKPIARNAIEGQMMVDAAKKNGKVFMVAQNYRFSSEAQTLKRFIDAGELGEIYFSRVLALRRRGIPSWGVFTDKEKQGGGPLIDIGVHVLDLAMYLMGHPKPISASGQTFTKIGNTPGHVGVWGPWDHTNYTVEDYAAGFIRFDNGTSMILESSFAANLGEEKMNVALMGTKGGAETGPLKIFSEKYETLIDITPAHMPKINSYEVEVKGFYDAIRNNAEPPVTGEQALNVMKILDALYESSEKSAEVIIK